MLKGTTKAGNGTITVSQLTCHMLLSYFDQAVIMLVIIVCLHCVYVDDFMS